MILSCRAEKGIGGASKRVPKALNDWNVYAIEMTDVEYRQLEDGKVLTKVVGCARHSGVIEVKFKKNSKKRHEELYG